MVFIPIHYSGDHGDSEDAGIVILISVSAGLKGNERFYRWTNDLRFTSFSTYFSHNQNDERLIMKGCVQ